MSQIFKSITSTPSVPTSFITDSGTATPAANQLNLITSDTTSNNDNGITDTGSGSTVTIFLTNRLTAQAQTTDATLTTIATFPLSSTTNTTYSMSGIFTARNTATNDSGSYDFYAAFKTNGVSATEVGTEYPTTFEDSALANSDIFVVASGNNVLFQVQGIAATINWDLEMTYRQVI